MYQYTIPVPAGGASADGDGVGRQRGRPCSSADGRRVQSVRGPKKEVAAVRRRPVCQTRRHGIDMGPLQYVFLGVRGQEQQQAVVRTLRALSERGAIRVVDVVYATKKDDGSIVPGTWTSLTDEERKNFGAIAGALVGFGYGGLDGAKAGAELGAERAETPFAEREFGESVQEVRQELKDLAEDLPTGAGCCIALIEHRWMPQLRDDLRRQGIVVLGTGMIRPRSLVMLGARLHAYEETYA
jgi:hypothetical protein